MVKYSHCDRGGTAYTTDLKSVGETLRVQIPPAAPKAKRPERVSLLLVNYPEGFEAVKENDPVDRFPRPGSAGESLRRAKRKQADA